MTDSPSVHGAEHGPTRADFPPDRPKVRRGKAPVGPFMLDRPNVGEKPVGPFKLDRPEVHRGSVSSAHTGPRTSKGEFFTKTPGSESKANLKSLSEGSARPAAPVPTPGKSPARQATVKAGPGAGAQFGARLIKGSGHAFDGATSNAGGLTAIMACVFGIVALAKFRGGANISTSHALFGGFLLLFMLTVLYKINARLALAFAVLVLIQALIEYGPVAFNGIGGLGSGIPAGAPLGTDVAAPVTSTGFLNSITTPIPATPGRTAGSTTTNTYNGGTISITKPGWNINP